MKYHITLPVQFTLNIPEGEDPETYVAQQLESSDFNIPDDWSTNGNFELRPIVDKVKFSGKMIKIF